VIVDCANSQSSRLNGSRYSIRIAYTASQRANARAGWLCHTTTNAVSKVRATISMAAEGRQNRITRNVSIIPRVFALRTILAYKT